MKSEKNEVEKIPTFAEIRKTLQEVVNLQKEVFALHKKNERGAEKALKKAQEEIKRQRQEEAIRRKEESARKAEEATRRKEEATRRKEEAARRKEEARLAKERWDKRDKEIDKLLGSWSNNLGAFAEEYFYNSFKKGQRNFFGEKFDEIAKQVKGFEKGNADEYDIILINGKTIGIIECKFKANLNDLPKVMRKADTFRVNFPKYKNYKFYLGLATLCFYEELEAKCIENGIAIIKQVGHTTVICDKHLKAY